MSILKANNCFIIKIFIIATIGFLVTGVLSVPAQPHQSLYTNQNVTDNAIQDKSLEEIFPQIILLGICIAQLDISEEEKADIFNETLGYTCPEIYVLALLFDRLDDYLVPLKIITEILWLLWDICSDFF